MATPPVQMAGSPFQTAWSGTTSPKTAVVGALGVGDLIVVEAANENTAATIGATPSNTAAGPATITWTARGTVTTASRCAAKGWTGVVTVAGNLTLSITDSPVENWGFIAWVYPAASHGGAGQVPVGATGTASAPTLSATWSANSAIHCVNADFTAAAITSRAYRTGAGTATESNALALDSNYSTEAFYHADSGAGGSLAVGMTAPASQTWSLVAIEVLGTTAAAAVLRPRQQNLAAVHRAAGW